MNSQSRMKSAAAAVLVGIGLLLAACGDDDSSHSQPAELDNQPPQNAFLADSPAAVTHGNSYNQSSPAYAGPEQLPPQQPEDYILQPLSFIPTFSSPYPDGSRVMWMSSYSHVLKIDIESDQMQIIDAVQYRQPLLPVNLVEMFSTKTNRELSDMIGKQTADQQLHEGEAQDGLSGIYIVLDNDGICYQGHHTTLVAYGDQIKDDWRSPIEIKRTYQIPPELLPREWDKIIGLNMTYDGMLVFITNYGLVGVVDRSFATAHYLQLGGGEEYVFNSVATDEDGGIYAATNKRMYRVQWTGDKLTTNEDEGGWSAGYETGWVSEDKYSEGTGATPTLMGSGDHDKFVVITDGEDVMNIVLFWRDRIPQDWQQIPGTRDRRIAAQVPITFGLTNPETSLTEQSVTVEGYGAFVVNNLLQQYEGLTHTEQLLLAGEADMAPYGCEKFEWDPDARELKSVWVNQEVSLPSTVATVSPVTEMVYSVGAREGVWTLEALDWGSGDSLWHYDLGNLARHNSFMTVTLIGPDGNIYSPNFCGLLRVRAQ